MPDGTPVYLSRNGYARAYHLFDDCRYLPDADRVRQTTAGAIEVHYDMCSVCEDRAIRHSTDATPGAVIAALENDK